MQNGMEMKYGIIGKNVVGDLVITEKMANFVPEFSLVTQSMTLK